MRLCKRYGVICTATPRHPGRPIMSHARAGRCATGVHRCFMRPGISTPAVRGATARRVALTRGRVASYSTSASAAALDHEHEHEPLTSPLPVAARFSGVVRYHGRNLLGARGSRAGEPPSRERVHLPPRTSGRAVQKLLGASRYSSRPAQSISSAAGGTSSARQQGEEKERKRPQSCDEPQSRRHNDGDDNYG